MLCSCACTQRQLQSPDFQKWLVRMNESQSHLHRKLWEWCYIAQALDERGMFRVPGSRGLGFAVGQEPLTSLFASYGCEVLATDLDESGARQGGWVETRQHASNLNVLNQKGLCPADRFQERVEFRHVDMRKLPSDLRGFDFLWSSCSIEHLGSTGAGIRFMLEMSRCLRPGGVAVHTTEYNVSSNRDTLFRGRDVLFRKRDLETMKSLLESLGHQVTPFDFSTGHEPADLQVDEPPYTHQPHLKLRYGPYVTTSLGIIVTAGQQPSWLRHKRAWARALCA